MCKCGLEMSRASEETGRAKHFFSECTYVKERVQRLGASHSEIDMTGLAPFSCGRGAQVTASALWAGGLLAMWSKVTGRGLCSADLLVSTTSKKQTMKEEHNDKRTAKRRNDRVARKRQK